MGKRIVVLYYNCKMKGWKFMKKYLTANEIRENIKVNNGVSINEDRHLDEKSQKCYKIKVLNENNDIIEIKVESEYYVNIDMWGIDINPTNENEFPQIYYHFKCNNDLKNVLEFLRVS